MEILQNDYTLQIPAGCFPLTTDSLLLADFVRLPANATVLDLGSGCGTLGLLLCAKDGSCSVLGLEIDPRAHEAALENIHRNGLDARLRSQNADLRTATGNYHCCVSNPPYYTGGPASTLHSAARRDDLCGPEELMQAASSALRYGGDLYIVHKPERLAQLCACGSAVGLEAKRLRLVRHRCDGPITLILLQLRKGGKPGLVIDEVFLHTQDGSPSDYYNKLYHL
jgi:tRNA1Val (adenine37-N6)-methyltransferase